MQLSIYLFLTVCVITLSSASAANVSTLQLNEREAQDNSEPLPPPWNDSSNDDRINLRSTSSSSQRRELSFWSSIMNFVHCPIQSDKNKHCPKPKAKSGGGSDRSNSSGNGNNSDGKGGTSDNDTNSGNSDGTDNSNTNTDADYDTVYDTYESTTDVVCDGDGCTNTTTDTHYDYNDDECTQSCCEGCCTSIGCVADTVDFVFYGLYDPTNAPTAYDTTSNDCDYYNTGTDCIKSAFTGNSNMMYGAVGLGGIAVVAALLGRKRRQNVNMNDHLLSGAVNKRNKTFGDIFRKDADATDSLDPETPGATHYVKA